MRPALVVGVLILAACSEKQAVEQSTSAIEAPVQEVSEDTKGNSSVNLDQDKSSEKPVKSEKYTAKATFTDGVGWGYDIYEGNAVRIHQPHIPAIEGNRGFDSEADALKIAQLVIYKMENGIVPPAVTKQEMIDAGLRSIR
jgi:hypothetical protein